MSDQNEKEVGHPTPAEAQGDAQSEAGERMSTLVPISMIDIKNRDRLIVMEDKFDRKILDQLLEGLALLSLGKLRTITIIRKDKEG